MGLRITQAVTINRALFNIQMNTRRLNKTREQLSTGFRINRPSDDPTTFLRMLPVRNSKKELQLFQENSVLARDILHTASTAFEDAVEVMSKAKEIAVAGANGTLGDADRKTLAATASQLLSEMLSLANSKLGDRFLFGGSATSAPPFSMNGNFVRYIGDDNEVTVQVAPNSETSITSSGKKLFFAEGRKATTFEGLTGAKPGSGTDSGTGLHKLTLQQTGISNLPTGLSQSGEASTALGNMAWTITPGATDTISVGGGPPVSILPGANQVRVQVGTGPQEIVIDIAGSYTTPGTTTGTMTSEGQATWDEGKSWTNLDYSQGNLQVKNSLTGAVLNLDAQGIARTGSEQVTFGGTFDAFNVLVALRDTLDNAEGASPGDVSKRLTAMIGEIDIVFDQLLEGLRDLGARGSQIDLTKDRMSRMELTLEEALSRDRDIDISEVILRMTQQDTAFQAALAVGGRIMNQSLLDYL
jgi:flagellar hook-associated protein 3 FlgL